MLGEARRRNARPGSLLEVRRMPPPASVMWTRFDLGRLGYVAEEFLVTGEARAFAAAPDPDGPLRVAGSAAYRTRVVVFRPSDPRRWSGTAVVEWLNCRSGVDTAPQWIRLHREMIRRGAIWVGVTAQRAGIEGAEGMAPPRHLKALDPQRYAALDHPGDAWSFDIFSQAAEAAAAGRLGFAPPACLLGTGSSQSARFLTTYVNRVDLLAGLFDGFLLSGRHRSAATLEGESICSGRAPIRVDVRVPVFVLQPETDPFGRMRSAEVRQPDTARYRCWEVAGAAHGDSYMARAGNVDDGSGDVAALAVALAVPPGEWLPLKAPMNASPAFQYVHRAALRHLEAWAKGGEPPPSAPCLGGDPATGIARDSHDVALGGVRTPWADCPAQVYSGENEEEGEFEGLFGRTLPLPRAVLAALYPEGVGDYLARFEQALRAAVAAGAILADDVAENLQLAERIFAIVVSPGDR